MIFKSIRTSMIGGLVKKLAFFMILTNIIAALFTRFR